MPNLDFQCANGHCFERVIRLSELDELTSKFGRDQQIPCNQCELMAVRQYTVSSNRDAQLIDTIVVFKDATGHIRVPGANDAATPKGFHRVELRTLGEARAIASHLDREAREEWTVSKSRERQHFDAVSRQNRSELFSRISTPFGRDFLRTAIAATEARRSKKYDGGYESGSYFDVTENDRGSREEYRDIRTGWRDKR